MIFLFLFFKKLYYFFILNRRCRKEGGIKMSMVEQLVVGFVVFIVLGVIMVTGVFIGNF